MFALEFPPIENLVEWPAYFGEGTIFEFNKIALISVLAVVIPTLLFLLSKKELVPSGLQNIVESTVGFVDKQVVQSAIGPDGSKYLPLLLSIFLFVFFGNIFEVIPTFQMPANARMANPVILALVAWATFIAVGVKAQGVGGFLKSSLFPPGVPKALYVLVTPIEFLSTFLLRPFGLAVRLFANMLAGHILLVTFGVLCIALWQKTALIAVLPFSFATLVALTGFEIMVSLIQAFVFSLLTAVYISLSRSAHH
ncbi:MAG: F0F1 ATP synthase subunit A [Acidimicrobiales bacterium]